MSNDRLVAQLLKTFKDEERFLKQGDFTRLARVSQRKESLMDSLKGVELDSPTMRKLSELSERSQGFLTAAQKGLQAAHARLEDIQRGAPVGTYSRSGEKAEFSKPVRTLQRRA